MSDKDRSLYFEYAMTALDYIVNHDDSIGNACKEIKNIVNKNQSK